MTASKIILGAASSAAGGAGLDVDEVYSTYTYSGNGSTNTITNNLDLSGEGGLVWIKKRNGNSSHFLFGSDRDANNKALLTNTQLEYYGTSYSVTHSSTGFNISSTTAGDVNENNPENYPNYVSWSFRKAPKFFDVVKVSSTSAGANTVSHSLGQIPGMIISKRTSSTSDWYVWHRSNSTGALALNSTNDTSDYNAPQFVFGNGTSVVQPTSTELTFYSSGGDYVFYIFAHHANDGSQTGFGSDGDSPVISCGGYDGNGSSTGPVINLGFEPQWVLIKNVSTAKEWRLHDIMRGMYIGDNANFLQPNSIAAEASDSGPLSFDANGFQLVTGGSEVNENGDKYIYIAIRRGPLNPPTDATKVFNVQEVSGATNSTVTTGFPVDLIIDKVTNDNDTQSNIVIDRVRGIAKENEFRKNLLTYSNGQESATANVVNGPSMTGYVRGGYWNNYTNVMFNWKRAPSFCDICAWSGTGSNRTISHNLTVPPEMIWVKTRSFTKDWAVYHTGLNNGTNPEQNAIRLNLTSGQFGSSEYWNDTAPTSSVFSLGNNDRVNKSTETYIAYLFATLAGISKIGSTSHTFGSDTNIDAGFSSGSRFVMIRSMEAGDNDWYVWNSASGIVAGNDPYIQFNERDAEVTNTDLIDPLSSGFTLTSNLASGNYIYYAIA